MRQSNLEIAVARATGEKISTIRRAGFSMLTPLPAEPDAAVLLAEWYAAEARLAGGSGRQPRCRPAA